MKEKHSLLEKLAEKALLQLQLTWLAVVQISSSADLLSTLHLKRLEQKQVQRNSRKQKKK